jgi:hypothetical protein
MAKRPEAPKTERRKVGRPKGSGVKDHVQTLVQLRRDQRAAIIDLAERRREPGRPPPFSEVVRELLDQALGAIRAPARQKR